MIKVEHLTKCYGDFMAVRDLSFEIGEGHVYGFLGPNGAGKSTTMNIMTGCLSPTDGKVLIGGHDILEEPKTAKKLIGYLPEQPPVYMNETPLEYLTFVGEAKGLHGSELKSQIEEVVLQTGIEHVQGRLIGTLSKGYRQRVGIAQALLGNPKVIILDEPTVGLDPIQIIEIRDLVKKLGETHTVIFSSHILSEIQAICEQVLIISKGRLVAFDTPENLEKLMTQTNCIHLLVQAKQDGVEGALKDIPHISSWEITEQEDGALSVTVKTDTNDTKEVCFALFYSFAAKNLSVYEMSSDKHSLEDVFIELTETGRDIGEGAAEPTAEPAAEPTAEPTAEAAAEPAAEPSAEPPTDGATPVFDTAEDTAEDAAEKTKEETE